MAQVIEVGDSVRETFRTILGGQNVRLTLWWQPFDAHWYLSLAWLDRRAIVSGVRLVENATPLLDVQGSFQGQLFVSGVGVPGRRAWTSTHVLFYFAPDEVGF